MRLTEVGATHSPVADTFSGGHTRNLSEFVNASDRDQPCYLTNLVGNWLKVGSPTGRIPTCLFADPLRIDWRVKARVL